MNPFRRLKDFHIPSISQWKKLPGLLSRKEKIAVSMLLVLFCGSFVFLVESAYMSSTYGAASDGGELEEGIAGSPRFINPVYSEANDPDRDLVQLIFSGLLKYNSAGDVTEDLAESYDIQEGGKVIEVILKDNVKWHDGFPFSADDVLFTIKTIQDQKYKSPIRANWIGVEVEKLSSVKLRFRLQQPYSAFLERLTLKILPAHIWESIGPENFALSFYNLRPVGTGPYRLKKIQQEKSGRVTQIQLERFRKYHGPVPHIPSLVLTFFDKEQEYLSYLKGRNNRAYAAYQFSLPRYFALFLNFDAPQGRDVMRKKNIRVALEAALNKQAIVDKALGGKATRIASPLRPDLFEFENPSHVQEYNAEQALALFQKEGYVQLDGKLVQKNALQGDFVSDLKMGSQGAEVRLLQECLAKDSSVYPEGDITGSYGQLTQKAVTRFQEKYAAQILAPSGLQKGTGAVKAGTREKLNELCSTKGSDVPALTITITTLEQTTLQKVAEEIKSQWKELGIETVIVTYPAAALEREAIKSRNYQTLLFGEILGKMPDPFPFWHSSQKKDPGLNLSSYENKKADLLLQDARKEISEEKREAKYAELQEILLEDVPAIFLYDIPYEYLLPKNVQGVQEQIISDPSQRFAGIENWYIKTKRAWR